MHRVRRGIFKDSAIIAEFHRIDHAIGELDRTERLQYYDAVLHDSQISDLVARVERARTITDATSEDQAALIGMRIDRVVLNAADTVARTECAIVWVAIATPAQRALGETSSFRAMRSSSAKTKGRQQLLALRFPR